MNQNILYGIGGLIIGSLAISLIGSGDKANQYASNEQMPMNHEMSMEQMMDMMNANLEGKSGDSFDEAFIDEMIMHHQGAIEMAELARTQAGHQEIKDLAEDIITAQTGEIEMMNGWKTKWFGTSPSSVDHSMHKMN